MPNLLIKHKVADYAAWKTAFDEFIGHTDDDPDNLVLLFEWDSLDNARSFMANPALRETMEKAGVSEPPEVYFLEEHYRGKTQAA